MEVVTAGRAGECSLNLWADLQVQRFSVTILCLQLLLTHFI